MPYDILTCTLHVYKPTVWPVASRSLFLDIQVVTLLLGKYTLFACANLNYATTSYFSTIFKAQHVYIYTAYTGCKRGFRPGPTCCENLMLMCIALFVYNKQNCKFNK